MMEASDVTGELRLCMQVIATAGMEQTRYGTNLLERENRFKELMQMFDRLDQIVYRYRNGLQKKEDAVFLKEQGITDTALLIALRIPGDDAARQKELFAQITADKKALDGTTADTVTVLVHTIFRKAFGISVDKQNANVLVYVRCDMSFSKTRNGQP